jgi:hypothetical protein
MKTLKRNSEVIRVSEEKIQKHLDMGYKYCSKSEWKKTVRDIDRKSEKENKK